MKTHELANALYQFAKLLKSGPNVQIESLEGIFSNSPLKKSSTNIAVNLATLAALSRITKEEWVKFVDEYGISITYRPRDSSRDILGKLLGYFEKNPDAIESLRIKTITKPSDASPELMKAFSILLREK